MNHPVPTRRKFLAQTAMVGAAVAVPSSVRAAVTGHRRHDSLRIACVGVGGMGRSDLNSVAGAPGAQIVGLCDVDAARLAAAATSHPDAAQFADYRRMLDALADGIDAVVVSTPDHMHGPVALAALDLGKHVYCQKPIAHNLHECRLMTRRARERGVVTQMGTQIHAHEAYQTAIATVKHGVLGKVRRAHLWVAKSWAGPDGGRPDREDPVPDGLDWDLWLGVAEQRPFVDGLYHPAMWRGWRDFGGGTLGDMGCHIFDPVFSALDLAAPRSVVASGPAHGVETFAGNGDVTYRFAGTAFTDGELELRWSDGDARPHRVGIEELEQHMPADQDLPGAGSFLVCERGVIVIPHWAMPKFFADGKEIEVDLQRRPSGNHYHEWVAACLGEGVASTGFDYSGPLTEAVLLGTLAGCFPGATLGWNAAEGTIDHEGAQALVRRRYRQGREIGGR